MTVTVDTLADVVDGNDGVTSLREAIAAAPSSGNTVDFHASLTQGVITLSSQLSLTQPITINGLGADKLTVAAGGNHRVFQVSSGVAATLNGMKITGGNLVNAYEEGAGIFNSGTLTLNSVEVSGNTTVGIGGGITSRNYSGNGSNSLYINDSTISDNHAVEGSGIAAYMGGGVLAIRRSTIANNVSQIPLEQWSGGAGIQLVGAVTSPLIENSTVSGNVSQFVGGIRLWAVSTPLNIVNSTIAYNRGLGGAGIDVAGGSAAPLVINSIFAQNTDNALVAAHLDVAGGLNPNSSYNLFGTGGGGTLLTGGGNQSGTSANPLDPLLSPLGNYGGSTKTHVPLPGSRAIDAGGPTSASTPATDQRGYRRVSTRPETNATSDLDIGAAELSQEILAGWLVTADFNGDHRNDQLLFDPVTREITGVTGAAVPGGFELGAWGSLWSDATITTGAPPTFIPGDFNGDGRDDVLIRTTAGAHVGISDGASFVFHTFQSLPGASLTGAWQDVYAGDVNGDGRDELVAWNGALSGWQVALFAEQTGQFSVDASWGNLGLFHETGARHYFADANGDGREDLIRRSAAGAWGVALSIGTQFVLQGGWSTTWFNGFYDESTNSLTADGPIKKALKTFENIYNNVELELYAGLMKGPEATRQTKRGNNWDQAALLEEELQALGLGSVKIASGRVRANVDRLREWLGLKSNVTNSALLAVLRSSLDISAAQFDSSTIEFTHAWVQALLPTPAGMAWVNFDPSWKFKDRQDGVEIPADLDAIHVAQSTGMFDEFSYLGLNPTADRRLPLEFFEDQVMDWLAKTTAAQGNSLADVPYDGPIKAKQFQTLPTGPGDGIALPAQPGVAQYEHFAAIATNATLSAEFAHRVTIRLKKNNDAAIHWTHDLVVPSHSLDAIQVTFGGSSATGVMTDPNNIATAGPFFSRLVVDGSVVKWADASESFSATDVVKIELVHLAPTKLTKVPVSGDPDYIAPGSPNYAGPTIADRIVPFTESPGNILSFGFDANQYSRDSLAQLQADVLAAVAGDTTQAQLIQDVDLLSSYAIAKYWHDYEEQNRAIAGITGAIGHQEWVGSGRISSKPSLLLDPTGAAGDYVIDYLAFGMAPANFGIDLPNSNQGFFEAASGDFHSEAWQLMGYNSSALEHTIVEEITSADSVSTIKGLQRAFQKNLGISIPGDATPAVTDDVISVFESRPILNSNSRQVYHLYNIRAGSPDVQIINGTTGQLLDANAFTNLLPSHNHNSSTQIDDKLWEFLSNLTGELNGVTNVVKALASKHRTNVDSWTGSVYLTDNPGRSMQFAIQPDGGSVSHGGYSGGVTTAPPPELPLGNFANASWAGDPVHVANGNMFREETDIVFPNIGVPLTFSRHYDSQSKDDVGMGVGWTYSFSDLLYADDKGTGDASDDEIVWITAAGSRHRFKKSGTAYVTPPELNGKLLAYNASQDSDGIAYRYFDSSGMEYHFQDATSIYNGLHRDGSTPYTILGKLRRQVDQHQNGVVINYVTPPAPSWSRQIVQISDVHDASRRLVYQYAAGVDRLTSLTKYNGATPIATWSYGYTDVSGVTDSSKRLVSASTPQIAVADDLYQESNIQTTTTYAYYNAAAGDPAYAKGLLKKITETDGAWHTYEYYRNGRAFRVKQGEAGVTETSPQVDVQTFSYNLVRSKTEFTDERGNVETYLHKSNGLLEKQIHAERSQIRTQWGGAGSSSEYLMSSIADERGAVESFTYYDVVGDFRMKQLKTSSSKSYPNAQGQFPNAIVTTFDYFQPANRPHIASLSKVIVDPGSGGELIRTSYSYDPDGRRTSTTGPDGHNGAGAILPAFSTTHAYYVAADGGPSYRLGLLKSVKKPAILDANGNAVVYETIFDYDAAGNVTNSKTQTVVTAPAVPTVIAETSYVYDSSGNLIRSVDPTGVATESVIDVLGRIRETGYGDSNAAIDPLDAFVTRLKYDKSGRVRESKDPLGRITRFEYDRQGNVVKQINPDGSSSLHQYDPFGNRIAATDPLGRTTRYVYDNRNHLIQTIHPDGASDRLRYDGAGNLIASTNALGNVTKFRYDASGRLVETKLPDPNSSTGTANPTTTNKYDKLGNLIETIDPEFNVTQFKYDKHQRVVESRTIDGREFSNKSVPQKLTIRNSGTSYVPTLGHNPVALTTTDYDAVGNLVRVATYDVSKIASIPSDPRSLITAPNIEAKLVQVVGSRYDAFGRPVKVISAEGSALLQTSTRTEYDAAGRIRYQYDELGRVTESQYDPFGRLAKTVLPDPDGAVSGYASPTTSYRYDAAHNRVATIDPRGFTTRFEYDAFNRLTATVDAQGNRSRVLYDVAGQMVVAVDALGRAAYTQYDNRGRAVQQRGADPDGAGAGVAPITRSFYDAAGRVVTKIDPLGYESNYTYDRLGRLTKESFAADYQIVDDGDPTFAVAGSSALTSQPADFNGDSRLVSNNGSETAVAWQFNGLQPGATYRVLATWTAHPTAATDLIFRLTDFYYDSSPNDGINNGVKAFWPEDVLLSGPNQRSATSDVLRFENDSAHGWTELHAGFTLDPNSDGSLAVHLASLQAIHADAIRIERIVSRSYQYDANGNLLKEIDPLSRETIYSYDELDRVVTEMLPDPDANAVGNGLLISPLTTTAYDGYGNVTRIVERRGNGANQRTTEYDYDSRNRRTEEIFDAGVDGTTNYLNRKTTFDYDDVGNLKRRLEFAENAATPGTFDLLRTTSYQYDQLDRLTSKTLNSDGNDNVTSPVEQVTTTFYDANGNVSQIVENANTSAALITQFVYDSLNRVAAETAVDLPLTPSSIRVTRFQYDAVGQQIALIDPLLRTSRSEFDRLGRLVKSSDPDPDGVGSLAPHATTFVYDAAGHLVLKNNGANEIAFAHETDRYEYDPQGRLIRSEDGRGDVTRRVYDVAGNLTKLIDPAGNATTYAYDALDRKVSEATAGGERQYKYDANGNLLYTVDRNGRATRNTYTRDDQITYERWYASLAEAEAGAGNYSGSIETYYDELGRLSEQQMFRRTAAGAFDYRATDSYLYDGLDRVVEHSNQSLRDPTIRYSATSGNVAIPAIKTTYDYAYNSSGQTVTREQFVAGQFAASTKSTYNAFDELVRQEDKDVSAASVASSILDFESTDAAFAYLADGSLASTTRYTDWDAALPGGAGHRNRVQTTYAYDGSGRIKNIAHSQNRRSTTTWPSVDTNLVSFAYSYDAASRVNSTETNWNQSLTAFSTRADETQTFAYDAAGQLTGVTSNLLDGGSSYSYAPNGNRQTANEPAAALNVYTPGPNNRIATTADVGAGPSYSYIYDNEGNLTERRLTTGDVLQQKLTWDHRNRLVKAENYNAAGTLVETIAYRYNADDDLIYRSVTPASQATQAEHYLVESGERTMTFDAEGDVKRRYGYGPTGEVLFDQIFDAAGSPTLQSETDLLLPLGDHQHSTRVVLAHDSGDATYVRQSLDYAQFGRVTATLGANGLADATGVVTAFAHHGSLHDAATGLQHKGERWYSPDLGRFVSEDPIEDGSNWYMFAGNDPVNYADPSGLSMQGYPLAGGYSGNVTREPTIKPGPIPANNLGGGPALSSSLNNFLKGAVNQAINPSGFEGAARAPASSFKANRPYQDVYSSELNRQRQDLEARRVANSLQYPPTNLFGPGDAARLAGINGELSDRDGNWLAPPTQEAGPSWNSVSKEQSDIARYRQLASKTRINNDEERELASLQIEYMTGTDVFNAVVDAAAAFVGGYAPRSGSGGVNVSPSKGSSRGPVKITPKTPRLATNHHLMTNKNRISTAAGGPFTPEFEKLVARRGITLQDPSNIVPLTGHRGPHPEYNAEVHKILTDATRGLKGEKFNNAFDQALDHVRTRTMTPGTKLNNLSTGRGGNK